MNNITKQVFRKVIPNKYPPILHHIYPSIHHATFHYLGFQILASTPSISRISDLHSTNHFL